MALGLALAAGITAVHEGDAVGQVNGRRQPAWLGVELDTTRLEATGVRVRHAVRSSPGWSAGIRDGDVIVRIDDVTTLRPDDVIRAVSTHAPGDVVRIAVLRAGAESALNATLGSLPDSDEVLRLDKVGAPAPTWKDLSAVSGPLPGALGELRGRVVIVDFGPPGAWPAGCRRRSSRRGRRSSARRGSRSSASPTTRWPRRRRGHRASG